jgi:hypothetical protein
MVESNHCRSFVCSLNDKIGQAVVLSNGVKRDVKTLGLDEATIQPVQTSQTIGGLTDLYRRVRP